MLTNFIPFLTILPVLLLALMSPGPTFVMVSNLALARGRKKGFLCAAGMATADLLYASLSLLGLGALLQEFSFLGAGLKILGGIYLAYIGYSMWRSTRGRAADVPAETQAAMPAEKNVWRLGFFTSLTNPKVIIFYGSMFTAALAGNPAPIAKIALPILCAATSLAWYGFVAFILSQPRVRLRYERLSKGIDRIAGTILILFGLRLIVGGLIG